MVRRTQLRSRRQESTRNVRTEVNREEEFNEKKETYLKAKKDFEKACIDKHGKPTLCRELATAVGHVFKGTGSKIGYAMQEMGDMTEKDLYERSPAGERDRAIIKVMMEQGKASAKRTTKKPGAYVMIHGVPVAVDQKDIIIPSRRARGRRY